MAIAGDGGIRVSGPPCREPRYGLKSVADVTQDNDVKRWGKGLEWDELECGYDPGVVSGQCPPLSEQRKTFIRGFDTALADPFATYAGWRCSSGAMEVADAWDTAQALLERNWWRSLERTFWTGLDQDANPIRGTLGQAVATDLTPLAGAIEISSGVAMLESFAADCFDCEPVLHANRGLATYFADRGLVERDGDQLRMLGTGSLFAPGGGYPTSGPLLEPAAPGEAWIYITGGVSLVHSGTFYAPDRGDEAGAVDKAVNDVTVFAERFAAFQLGCCVGAVRVILLGCCCAGATAPAEESS